MTRSPKYRGVRYTLVWLIAAIAWITLFLESVFALRSSWDIPRLVWAGLLLYTGSAVYQGYRVTRPARFPIFHTDPDVLGFAYEDVDFHSRDGLQLSGWFVPPQNGAVIVLTHGFSSNRLMLSPVARILAQHGYGVLLYDLRAHGRSQGNLSTWGWLEANDLLGALDYLQSRADVDLGRIGALGFSLGGQVTLRAAAQTDLIQAVIADGPSPCILQDHLVSPGLSPRKLFLIPYLWLAYKFQALLTGVAQPPGILESIPKVAPRPLLLISTGIEGEQRAARAYFAAAREPKMLYEIPEARHGEGLIARPEEYEARLLDFFDRIFMT